MSFLDSPPVPSRSNPLLPTGRCVPYDVQDNIYADGCIQLSAAEDSLRASESVEESLMNTLQRTIEGYEAYVFFRSVPLVSD